MMLYRKVVIVLVLLTVIGAGFAPSLPGVQAQDQEFNCYRPDEHRAVIPIHPAEPYNRDTCIVPEGEPVYIRLAWGACLPYEGMTLPYPFSEPVWQSYFADYDPMQEFKESIYFLYFRVRNTDTGSTVENWGSWNNPDWEDWRVVRENPNDESCIDPTMTYQVILWERIITPEPGTYYVTFMPYISGWVTDFVKSDTAYMSRWPMNIFYSLYWVRAYLYDDFPYYDFQSTLIVEPYVDPNAPVG